jgi:ATP-dependent Clp protease adaptor protein ClpS
MKSVKGKFLMIKHVIDLQQASVIQASGGVLTPEKTSQTVRKPYPSYKVIVLNDDENTFEHVVNTLVRYIPGMVTDRAWGLADQVHHEGQAIVWTGPLEQAELYHMQLTLEGLTMAPLEAA